MVITDEEFFKLFRVLGIIFGLSLAALIFFNVAWDLAYFATRNPFIFFTVAYALASIVIPVGFVYSLQHFFPRLSKRWALVIFFVLIEVLVI